MNWASLLEWLHVAAAFWMIAGILGRTVTMSLAERSADIRAVQALLPAASAFERGMVIPGSNLVLAAGLVTAWLQGWPILGFLQGGRSNWVLASLVLMLTIIPLIVLVFLPRGKLFARRVEEAAALGQVTPELTAAFRDPLVRAAHVYELAALAVIVFLMVVKPF